MISVCFPIFWLLSIAATLRQRLSDERRLHSYLHRQAASLFLLHVHGFVTPLLTCDERDMWTPDELLLPVAVH